MTFSANNFFQQNRHDMFTVMSNDQIILSHFDSKNPALSLVHEETLDGRRYIVVPMVMLTEGVHKGSNGPIYYSPDEISRSPEQWGSKPIIIDHPYNGKSGSELETYKKQRVGMVMHPTYENGKLKAEAWLDIENVKEKCPQILTHIEHGLPMEVSTGLLNEIILEPGVWHGEQFIGKIAYIRADHLAILPREQGACSISDGAGLLLNSQSSEPVISKPNTYNSYYVTGDVMQGSEYPLEPLKREEALKHTQIPATPQPLPFNMPNIKQQESFLQHTPQSSIDPNTIAAITAAVSATLMPMIQSMQAMKVQIAPNGHVAQPNSTTLTGGQIYGNSQTVPSGASVTQVAPGAPNQEQPNQDRPGLATAQQPLVEDQAEYAKQGVEQLRNPVRTLPSEQAPENVPLSGQGNLSRTPQTKQTNMTNNDMPQDGVVQEMPLEEPAQPELTPEAQMGVPQDPQTMQDAQQPAPPVDAGAEMQPEMTPGQQPGTPSLQQAIDLLQQAINALQQSVPQPAVPEQPGMEQPVDPAMAAAEPPVQEQAPAGAPEPLNPVQELKRVNNVKVKNSRQSFRVIKSKRTNNAITEKQEGYATTFYEDGIEIGSIVGGILEWNGQPVGKWVDYSVQPESPTQGTVRIADGIKDRAIAKKMLLEYWENVKKQYGNLLKLERVPYNGDIVTYKGRYVGEDNGIIIKSDGRPVGKVSLEWDGYWRASVGTPDKEKAHELFHNKDKAATWIEQYIRAHATKK